MDHSRRTRSGTDADPLAGAHGGDLVADLDHLGDALVPERERGRERRGAADDERVEVASGYRKRAHKRRLVGAQAWLGRFAPRELVGT
jgi:hypothetical protein